MGLKSSVQPIDADFYLYSYSMNIREVVLLPKNLYQVKSMQINGIKSVVD